MLRKLISRATVSLLSVLIFLAVARAQTRPATTSPSVGPPSAEKDKSDSDDKPPLGSIEDEMRVRRMIKLAEKEYKENVERAREAADLGAQLRDTAKEGHSFGHDETRKLERLEKLTKKIRTEAGGSDEDDSINNPPGELQSALTRLADVSESLYKTIEKTPRQVISASIIAQANAVLQLSKIARNFFH
jgi:hypothetical protein